MRTGIVVALSIPLVLAITFLAMYFSISSCNASRWAC